MTFSDKGYFASLPVLNKNTSIIINGQTFTVTNVKKKNKSFVLALKDIDTLEKAKELIGFDVFIDSLNLPELDNDTFYEAELMGYKIIDNDNNIYGEITDVYSIPSNYVFEIKLAENGNIVSFAYSLLEKSRDLKTAINLLLPKISRIFDFSRIVIFEINDENMYYKFTYK